MGPEVIGMIIFGIQAAIKYAPGLAVDIQALLSKGNPTEQDWIALRDKHATKSYAELVPNSGLTPTP